MDKKALFNLSYGLYLITTKSGEKANGCIVNTVTQITDTPTVIAVAVNKSNYTTELIANSGKFCVSVLSEKATFDFFKRFGFHSGRDVDKFDSFPCDEFDGLPVANDFSNAYLSCKVINTVDFSTHVMFVAEVIDAVVTSDDKSCTYAYYHANIKPKPQPEEKSKGWRCKICGYVYEGETLPPDFICPWCKHPASDFEKI
ncbi:MAG: flavin reductase [Clostridia bacterium]|nr:flavin reductase [Clostridia bacterium]